MHEEVQPDTRGMIVTYYHNGRLQRKLRRKLLHVRGRRPRSNQPVGNLLYLFHVY